MSIDIQALAIAAHDGDSDAYEQLAQAYLPEIQRRAENVARRNPSIDSAELESNLCMALMRCVAKFDAGRGNFVHFVNNAFAKEALNSLYSAGVRGFEKNERTRLEAPAHEGVVMIDTLSNDIDVASSVVDDLALNAWYEKARQVDVTLAEVLRLIVSGETYEGIARSCGFEGSDEAAKMWTTRRVDELARIIVDVGDVVQVVTPKYNGKSGVVVDFTRGTTDFTHVVKLDDGRTLAFHVRELRLKEAM